VKNPDGSITTTTENRDGSVTTTTEDAEGTTSTVKIDAAGKTVSAAANVSDKAIAKAEKNDAPVTLPLRLKAAGSASEIVSISVRLPATDKPVAVEIPVEDLTAGTTAVIVHEDGSEEIVKTSVNSENGVVLALSGNATVKIVDNTKRFKDVTDKDWFADVVAWAASRGIMNGVGNDMFDPDAKTTRAMVAQLLFNLDGAAANGNTADLGDVDADDWYSDSVTWMIENGLAKGEGGTFGADKPATREAVAVFLYNYAIYKGYDVSAAGDMSGFTDAGSINEWAEKAMRWAVGAGLFLGDGKGHIDPKGLTTRAQMTALIERFCEKVANKTK
jgi:hypothetical protein